MMDIPLLRGPASDHKEPMACVAPELTAAHDLAQFSSDKPSLDR
jgi:hypothetical protein